MTVDLCTSRSQTRGQAGGNCLESILRVWICRARRIPGSNLLLKTMVLVKTTLSPGDCCHSLMTDFQGCFRFASCSLQLGTRQRKGRFPFPFSPLRGMLQSYIPSEDQAGCIQAGVERADPHVILPSSCPIACLQTHSKSTCLASCGFGISLRSCLGMASTRIWYGGGGRGEVEEEEKERRRRRREADAGVLVSQPSA